MTLAYRFLDLAPLKLKREIHPLHYHAIRLTQGFSTCGSGPLRRSPHDLVDRQMYFIFFCVEPSQAKLNVSNRAVRF